jgi:DNA-binding MarR family transcriptional regulator
METCITLAIHEMVWRMDAAADGILQHAHGIGFEHARVLMTLRLEQPCSQRNLAAKLGITPAAVTRALPRFVEPGWIEVRVDPKQPRRNLLQLTDEGLQLADSCWQTLETAFHNLLTDARIEPEPLTRTITHICTLLNPASKKEGCTE